MHIRSTLPATLHTATTVTKAKMQTANKKPPKNEIILYPFCVLVSFIRDKNNSGDIAGVLQANEVFRNKDYNTIADEGGLRFY